uniref:Centromere protein S n=1 Tax=Dicentrarchus labrax TaxID=13489 RepID=A0A8C4DFG8_DICLA
MSVDKEEAHQRLKAAVHYTVSRICQKMGEDYRREFSRQVIAAIAETAVRQCDIFAKDLEAFARQQIECLICLYLFQSIYIQNKSEELNQEQRDLKKKSTGKRKSRDTEEEESRQ